MGNSPVTGEFSVQRPVTRSFDVSFDLRLNQQMSKPWWRWWFETPSCSLWRHCNAIGTSVFELRSLVSVQVVKLELIVLTVTLSELHDVTHHEPRGCWFNSAFSCATEMTPKVLFTCPWCEELLTIGFPSQRSGKSERVSIPLRHH